MSIPLREFPVRDARGMLKLIFGRLGPAISLKHGYTDFDKYMDEAASKFSLLETGILDKPSCRLLFINVSPVHCVRDLYLPLPGC
jgi:hypothetical protein